jgi:hypothetical protein
MLTAEPASARSRVELRPIAPDDRDDDARTVLY